MMYGCARQRRCSWVAVVNTRQCFYPATVHIPYKHVSALDTAGHEPQCVAIACGGARVCAMLPCWHMLLYHGDSCVVPNKVSGVVVRVC